MKISKIYSDNPKFKTLNFHDGLNIILGRIENPSKLSSSSHNLGKSALVDLIDFLFLKELKKGHFLKDFEEKFLDYTFFMELKKSAESYVTIKRSVIKNSKISFKFHNEGKQNFIHEKNWDFKELPLTTKDPNKNPIDILNSYWSFSDIFPTYNYRKFLSYFLRTQYDYDEVFKLSKYKGNDSSWKPALALLMGLNGNIISEKYDTESNINSLESTITKIETDLGINEGDFIAFQEEINSKQQKIFFLRNQLENFNFTYLENENIIRLVKEIEDNINKLNHEEYKILTEISKIQSSIENSNLISETKVIQLFNELNLYFPDQLKKEYDELIQFNNQLTFERISFLRENLYSLENKLSGLRKELSLNNIKRSIFLENVISKDSILKFKFYNNQLIELEKDITLMKSDTNGYGYIDELYSTLNVYKTSLSKTINNLKKEIFLNSEIFFNIQTSFEKLSNIILGQPATIKFHFNSKNNIDFEAVILEEDVVTAKSEGYSYKKMLCVCFDLALILNYNFSNFYKFIYHDGSMESMSNTKKINYLNEIKKICNENNIQYIFTMLEDDIPRYPDNTLYTINESEITVVLDDSENDSGRLFGISY